MKRKKVAIILFGIALVLALVCVKNFSGSKKIDLHNRFALIHENQVFTLSQINIADNWDAALVIGPYNTAGVDKIKMDDAIKSDIKSSAFGDEGYCTLIFEKGGELVSYAFVPRTNCADFSDLDNIQIQRDEKLRLTKKRVVKKE
ncbi:MAG: hypothetical protein H6Q14_2491 [Bacteroidetes bacterium]|jgi:hypothetical protein|nr:hypothetical protein [Bacteroidota bacterium]